MQIPVVLSNIFRSLVLWERYLVAYIIESDVFEYTQKLFCFVSISVLIKLFLLQEAPDYLGMNVIRRPIANMSQMARAFGVIYQVRNPTYNYTGEYVCQYTENSLHTSKYIYIRGQSTALYIYSPSHLYPQWVNPRQTCNSKQ